MKIYKQYSHKFNDRKNFVRGQKLLNISHKRFEYLRPFKRFYARFAPRKGRLSAVSRAKYLVSVRKLQEEGERRVFPKNLAKYRNSMRKFSRVTGERIPFFHPGASRCITRDKCSNKYFTEHASRKRSAEINPNRYGGKCSRPFKYLKKHGRLKFVLPPGRSQIFAKPVMNICIEDLCKFVYVNMREREREGERIRTSLLRIDLRVDV